MTINTLMLSSLAELSYEEKVWLNSAAILELSNEKFLQNKSKVYDNQIVERFYRIILRKHTSFKRSIKPIDLLIPIIVQPQRANARIIKQDGAFILSGLSKNVEDSVEKIERMVDLAIIVNDREKILNELDSLGINEATLFPEMDNVASYLKSKIQA